MLKVAEYSHRKNTIKSKAQQMFLDAGLEFSMPSSSEKAVRLVFAGQFSAGKSTILRMLTGKTDIETGAGITTQQVNVYNWNGLEVVDTPGIHTERRPDHDIISYEAIASADILVFVITNELFDAHIAEHFRRLAIDKDKAGEMILVVNKMERAADGNSIAQQKIIREDLRKVLVPYTPEQVNLSFLDAQSYLDGTVEADTDMELAEELIARSGYGEFIRTLNRFVQAKGISSKFTTELYMLDEQLENAIKQLQPRSTDVDIDALEESFIQQRHMLIESRGRIQQEVRDLYVSAASQIRDTGLNAANLIVDGCKQDEVEEALGQAVRDVDEIAEKCQIQAVEIIDARLNEIGQRLEDIENSEFSRNLKSRLEGKVHSLPDGVQQLLSKAGTGAQKAGHAIIGKAYKAGTNGGLKLTNFSGSNIHDAVLKVGHMMGYKFKPWQAIKLTRGIAIGGQVLSAFGIGLSVFMQIKADHDEEQMRNNLRTNRQNVRSQFNVAANELEDYGKRFVKEKVNPLFGDAIATLDFSIQEIRESRLSRNGLCRNLEALQKDCQLLIQDIHANDFCE